MALSAPFSVLLGFPGGPLLGPSRRLPRLLPFGLSSVGPCGLPVALCPCSAFPLACGLLCVFLAALARALLPSFFVAPGPSSFLVCVLFPSGSLVFAFFGSFPGMLGAR